jgi:superfamily II DNA or RNA helicase
MGNVRALYACPQHFKWYKERNVGGKPALVVPRGHEARVRLLAEDASENITTKDERCRPKPSKKLISKIKLRPYQYGVIEEIDPENNTQGIIRLDTGFGKTIIALKLIEKIQTKTLIIVPKLQLLAQFEKAVNEYFNTRCGVIQSKRFDIQDITVATVQTLQKRIDSGELSPQEFGCVIADECHLFVPKRANASLQFFESYFRFGLTATNDRGDGQKDAIRYLFGPVLVDRNLERESPTVEIIKYNNEELDRAWEYTEMINQQIEDDARNGLIAYLVDREVRTGRKVLVLTKRVKHYENIGSAVAEDCELVYLRSRGSAKSRAMEIESLRDGTTAFDCLFGTFSLLSTGVDIPQLDTLIIAGDLRSRILTEQSAGRILRLFEGKKKPKIIDVQDVGNGILKNQARERTRFYKKRRWEIT